MKNTVEFVHREQDQMMPLPAGATAIIFYGEDCHLITPEFKAEENISKSAMDAACCLAMLRTPEIHASAMLQLKLDAMNFDKQKN